MKTIASIFLNLKLQAKIMLLASGIVFLSIIISGLVLIENFTSALEDELGSRALAIARTVAQMEEIQNNVGHYEGHQVIQPIAERIRLATNVEYIVVFDMDRIRHSHPLQNRIGEKFSGGDEGPALADHEYISKAIGVLGPSVRAFVPIKVEEGTKQVGVVVVGILTPTISKILADIRVELYFSLMAGLLFGIMGAALLASNIKRTLFNLEPEEIARILEERIAIFQSIKEGIIAIDRENKITIINEEAKKMMNLTGDVTGEDIRDVVPQTELPLTAASGNVVYNHERRINNNILLVNRLPIRVKGKVVGAVSTFRDKTEIKKLAEELTGVKVFIEALRVQNHEHMNKLHTIAGLIQLKRYEEAIDYIFKVNEEQQAITQFLSKNIKEYSVAGLLLGKYSRAKELKISMEIDEESRLKQIPQSLDASSIVIIVGNLIENSMEATQGLEEDRRRIYCLLREEKEKLRIVVKDWGRGIGKEVLDKIFTKGFSTKGSENRGIGLALVKQYVEMAGGKINIESEPGRGTKIEVVVPKALKLGGTEEA